MTASRKKDVATGGIVVAFWFLTGSIDEAVGVLAFIVALVLGDALNGLIDRHEPWRGGYQPSGGSGGRNPPPGESG